MRVSFCPFCGMQPIVNREYPGHVSCVTCEVQRFEVIWEPAPRNEALNEADPWADPIWDRVRAELLKNTPAQGGA